MARPLTTTEVNQRLASRGIQMVGEWQGVTKRYTFTCQCGHTWQGLGQVTVVNGSGCLMCFRKNNKLDTDDVNAALASRGITLLGTWKGHHKPHVFRCEAGHEWSANGQGPVMHGSGCPHCTRQDKFFTPAQVAAALPEGVTLVGEWKGSNKRNRFTCSKGHVWQTIGSSALSGSGCPQCYANSKRLNLSQVRQRLQVYGLSLVGEWKGSNGLNQYLCERGHTWQVKGSAPLWGSGCPHCAVNAMLTKEEIALRLEARGITLQGKWRGVRARYTFTCRSGHQWQAKGFVVKNGTGCPTCNGRGFPRLTTEEVTARLARHGLSLVGEWKGKVKSNRFRCSLGHQWETSGGGPISSKDPSGCPECTRLNRKGQAYLKT